MFKFFLFKGKKLKKWKLVNTDKYRIEKYPYPNIRFELTPEQTKLCRNIYKHNGSLEYTFYPCSGIGWGCKVKVRKTGEIINITDVSSW